MHIGAAEGLTEIKKGIVIAPTKLEEINTFLKRSEELLGLRMTSLLHKSNGDVEFFVNGGGSILISSDKDMNETFENLQAVLVSDAFKHIAPGNFKYIDVRFTNKAFVNESVGTTTESTTTVTNLPE